MDRHRSSSDGLMSRTLGFVRSFSDVDLEQTERSLEREIRRESCIPPRDKPVARLRLKGEHVLHSKYVLLAVVVLNLVDCALVLGELILDIHYIKELRDEREALSQRFVNTMEAKYSVHLRGHHIENLNALYEELYLAECYWPSDADSNVTIIATDGLHGFHNASLNGFDFFHNYTVLGLHNKTTKAGHGHHNDTFQGIHNETTKGGHGHHNDTFQGIHNETTKAGHGHHNDTFQGIHNETTKAGHGHHNDTFQGIHNETTKGGHGFHNVTIKKLRGKNNGKIQRQHEPRSKAVRKRRNIHTETKTDQHGPSYTVESDHGDPGDHGNSNSSEHGNGYHGSHHREHSVWENVAHGMHKASITILGILFVENLAKAICMGKDFLIKKLEVFDAIVVIISFVVDLVLLKGLMEFKIQDVVFILTFLLPWRVIRVVNSLIVAVLDHEHFRLKLLYQEKKRISAELKVLKKQEKGWDFHLQKIEKFCESEGIPKWKIRQHTAMGRKQSTITTMASLALNGFLRGMMLMSPSDQEQLERTMTMSSHSNTPTEEKSLSVIAEAETPTEDLTDVSFPRNTSAPESKLYYVTDYSTKEDTSDNPGAEDHLLDVNHQDNHHEHGILKTASKGTFGKNVSFVAKEQKPLLLTQVSTDSSDDGIIFMDANTRSSK